MFNHFFTGVSLVAQAVKSLPPMQKNWVHSLGQEDPLEEGMQATPVFLPGESHGRGSLVAPQSMGSQRVGHG